MKLSKYIQFITEAIIAGIIVWILTTVFNEIYKYGHCDGWTLYVIYLINLSTRIYNTTHK